MRRRGAMPFVVEFKKSKPRFLQTAAGAADADGKGGVGTSSGGSNGLSAPPLRESLWGHDLTVDAAKVFADRVFAKPSPPGSTSIPGPHDLNIRGNIHPVGWAQPAVAPVPERAVDRSTSAAPANAAAATPRTGRILESLTSEDPMVALLRRREEEEKEERAARYRRSRQQRAMSGAPRGTPAAPRRDGGEVAAHAVPLKSNSRALDAPIEHKSASEPVTTDPNPFAGEQERAGNIRRKKKQGVRNRGRSGTARRTGTGRAAEKRTTQKIPAKGTTRKVAAKNKTRKAAAKPTTRQAAAKKKLGKTARKTAKTNASTRRAPARNRTATPGRGKTTAKLKKSKVARKSNVTNGRTRKTAAAATTRTKKTSARKGSLARKRAAR
jgi:hypothetical protein